MNGLCCSTHTHTHTHIYIYISPLLSNAQWLLHAPHAWVCTNGAFCQPSVCMDCILFSQQTAINSVNRINSSFVCNWNVICSFSGSNLVHVLSLIISQGVLCKVRHRMQGTEGKGRSEHNFVYYCLFAYHKTGWNDVHALVHVLFHYFTWFMTICWPVTLVVIQLLLHFTW
jgi:hypothetical protein